MGIHRFGRDSRATDKLTGQDTFNDRERTRFTRTDYRGYTYPRRRRTPELGFGFIAGLIVLGVISVIGFNVAMATVAGSATCTVVDKNFAEATASDGTSHGVYRIATSDCGVFEIHDNIFRGKFNSADTYYSIKVGGTYHFDYTGFRVPLFSAFPRIVSATSVATDTGAASATQG